MTLTEDLNTTYYNLSTFSISFKSVLKADIIFPIQQSASIAVKNAKMNAYIIFVILQLNVEVVTMDTVLLLTTACK